VNSKVLCNNLLESEYNLLGYNLYSVNICVNNKRGIIVYVDCNLSSCQIEIDHDFAEFMFIEIIVNNCCTITLGAFYRSPNSSLDNDNKLITLLDSLKGIILDKLILLGDFNLPNINWSNCSVVNNANVNSIGYRFIQCLNDNYLAQHVLFPTRARGTQTLTHLIWS